MKILLVIHDPDLRTSIEFTLTQADYDICSAAADTHGALQAFAQAGADLVLLELGAEPMQAIGLCREIRRRSQAPAMMLSAHDREDELIAAFEAGVDDYLRTPFSPRVLLARIKALLRRAETAAPKIVIAGKLRLDLDEGTLHVGTIGPIPLTPLESSALQLFIRTPGRTVTAERLLTQLWGANVRRGQHVLKQLIYRLRHKIEADPSAPQLLVTTQNAGYKLIAD